MLPNVSKGSVCKKLNLMFRWMVRKDGIDLGLWDFIPSSMLIIPTDTHIYQFALKHGITQRKTADIKTAIEITNFFKQFSENDPVKYDFCITRPGIIEHQFD